MFGFKPKELNEAVLLPNLADTVMEVWLYEDALKPDQLLKESWFLSRARGDDNFANHIMQEKLALAAAFGGLVIVNTLKRQELVQPFFEAFGAALEHADIPLRFKTKAKAYMEMFTELSPRDAGEAVEATFAKAVFGDVPGEHEVNARYRLYKDLSKIFLAGRECIGVSGNVNAIALFVVSEGVGGSVSLLH